MENSEPRGESHKISYAHFVDLENSPLYKIMGSQNKTPIGLQSKSENFPHLHIKTYRRFLKLALRNNPYIFVSYFTK